MAIVDGHTQRYKKNIFKKMYKFVTVIKNFRLYLYKTFTKTQTL